MYSNRRVTRSMAKKMAMAKAKKATPTKKRVTKSKKVAPSRRVTRSMTKKAKKIIKISHMLVTQKRTRKKICCMQRKQRTKKININ